jgi:glycosyltransferase involved in cell wall biosynthesis
MQEESGDLLMDGSHRDVMKICFISESQSIHTRRWTHALAEVGCDVHLIAAQPADIPGVTSHCLPIYASNPCVQFVNIVRVRLLLNKLKPDVIHLFGLFSVNNLKTMWLIKPWRNLILSVWGSDIVPSETRESLVERFVKRRIVGCGRLVCATSDYLASETRRYARPGQRIETLPWGVDMQEFTPGAVGPKRHTVVVGFAKRLHTLAGPDVLIRAYHQALQNKAPVGVLRIAGTGPMEPELRILATTLGIADRIEWVGWLDTNDKLCEFYRSLDIFVMPSRRESFGVAAVEASACGVPVIASRFGGIPEIVEDGSTGLLVAPDDVEWFGRAIGELASDPARRRTMGAAARRRMLEKFDWTITVSRMVTLYSELNRSSR